MYQTDTLKRRFDASDRQHPSIPIGPFFELSQNKAFNRVKHGSSPKLFYAGNLFREYEPVALKLQKDSIIGLLPLNNSYMKARLK